MAIFEQKAWGKIILDDTEALKATFQSTVNVQGHTEYVIHVQRGSNPDKSWDVCKRYNDFVGLHNSVILASGISISLPPKKIIGNMDRAFIAERQLALQNYINSILMNPILASNLAVKRFLDPKNYVLSLQELAAQQVSMVLRSEVNYELLKPVSEMGWRLRKQFLMVRDRLNPRTEMVLQWMQFGPDKYLSDRDVLAFLRALCRPIHTHIEPLAFAHCSESENFVIRKFYNEGTLRDYLCFAKPKGSFLKKYGNPKQIRCLPEFEIAIYGRQILDALIFLHDKNIPYGHLHTGNILILDGQVKLLDIENGIVGVPSYLRPFYVQHKKICTLDAVDVYCFGHVLYEMAIGRPLLESVCDNFPPPCPASVRAVLDLILTPESCRRGLPSLTELHQHPFFNFGTGDSATIHFKLPSALREAIKTATVNTVLRLRNEQKMVRDRKKLAKVQELLTSEDYIRKRNNRLKEEKKVISSNSKVGARSPPRSDSPTSTSTATSAGTVTPPLQGLKPATPPVVKSTETNGRSALLDSICSFDKSCLRPRAVNGATH